MMPHEQHHKIAGIKGGGETKTNKQWCEVYKGIFKNVQKLPYFERKRNYPLDLSSFILYIKEQCLSVWAVPGRFFQSLPVPCGVLNCLSFWPLGVCLHWGVHQNLDMKFLRT
jgi:hypothetical protein